MSESNITILKEGHNFIFNGEYGDNKTFKTIIQT